MARTGRSLQRKSPAKEFYSLFPLRLLTGSHLRSVAKNNEEGTYDPSAWSLQPQIFGKEIAEA